VRQSTIIFGTLLAAFVIYITLRGQLPDYLALFTKAAPSNTETKEAEQTSKPLYTPEGFKSWMDGLELGERFI
jgi:hypothetical protein